MPYLSIICILLKFSANFALINWLIPIFSNISISYLCRQIGNLTSFVNSVVSCNRLLYLFLSLFHNWPPSRLIISYIARRCICYSENSLTFYFPFNWMLIPFIVFIILYFITCLVSGIWLLSYIIYSVISCYWLCISLLVYICFLVCSNMLIISFIFIETWSCIISFCLNFLFTYKTSR